MLIRKLKFTKDKDIEKNKYIDDILKNMKITLFGFIPDKLTSCIFDQHVKYILDCHYNNTPIKIDKSQINIRGLNSESIEFKYTISMEGEITDGILKTKIYLIYAVNYINDNIIEINLIQFHISNRKFKFREILPIIDRLVIDINAEPEVKKKLPNIELAGLVSDEEYKTVENIFNHIPRIKVTDNFFNVFMNDLLKNAIYEIYRRNSNSDYRVFASYICEYTAEIHIYFEFGDVLFYRCTYDKENHILSIKNIKNINNNVNLPLVIRNLEMEYHLVREEN